MRTGRDDGDKEDGADPSRKAVPPPPPPQQQQQRFSPDVTSGIWAPPPAEHRKRLLRSHFPQGFVDAFLRHEVDGEERGREEDSDSDSDRATGIDSDALVEALEKAPELVAKESPYRRYLVMLCGSESTADPRAIRQAASRIAAFWTMRKRAFGPYRAFLPMIMTPKSPSSSPSSSSSITPPEEGKGSDRDADDSNNSDSNNNSNNRRRSGRGGTRPVVIEGALSEEDMRVLESGWGVILPPTADPVHRRTVVCTGIDSAMGDAAERRPDAAVRVAYYILYLASTNPASQTRGVAGIVPLASALIAPESYYSQLLPFIRDALPIKRLDVYFVSLASNMTNMLNTSLQIGAFLFSIGQRIYNIFVRNKVENQIHLLFGITDEQVMVQLIQRTSFNRADIATWCGGSGGWDYGCFQRWIEKQMKTEQSMYMSPEQKARKKRAVNAQRSQRKRDRALTREVILREQAWSLREENDTLKTESGRLESLLAYARVEVGIVEGIPVEDVADGGPIAPNDVFHREDAMCARHERIDDFSVGSLLEEEKSDLEEAESSGEEQQIGVADADGTEQQGGNGLMCNPITSLPPPPLAAVAVSTRNAAVPGCNNGNSNASEKGSSCDDDDNVLKQFSKEYIESLYIPYAPLD